MTGLLAAQALKDLKIEYTLYDMNPDHNTSSSKGLHYLHLPCGLDLKPQVVYNYIIGCHGNQLPNEAYASKVGVDPTNSVARLRVYTEVYDFHQALKQLKETHDSKLRNYVFKPGDVPMLLKNFDYVISTIPLPLVYPEAKCESVKVGVKRGRPKVHEIPSSFWGANTNMVIYNVDKRVKWYRYSNILGVEWTEVTEGGDFTISKVVTTDFHPPDERVILMGRWGAWDKTFLAHQAYEYTIRRFIV